MRISQTVSVPSPAKVNLFLEVLRKREDGYHELETIFQEIDLCDEIVVHPIESPHIEISTDSPQVPTDSSNLAFRAALAFFKKTGISPGVHIRIIKRIPVAAGLGGGSSNAAATLKALEELFQISLDSDTLFSISRSLGADVPFFLKGKTALGRGIGDLLKPLENSKKFFLLLLNPLFKVSTADVYQSLSLGLTQVNSDITLVEGALKQGDVARLGTLLFNRLEDVVLKRFPQLDRIKSRLKEWGALGTLLSGSGPTLFAMTRTRDEAIKLQEGIQASPDLKCWTRICETA